MGDSLQRGTFSKFAKITTQNHDFSKFEAIFGHFIGDPSQNDLTCLIFMAFQAIIASKLNFHQKILAALAQPLVRPLTVDLRCHFDAIL